MLKALACGSVLRIARAHAPATPAAALQVPLTSPQRPPRLIVLDWGLIETLLAMGVKPLGVAESDAYNDSVVTPVVPVGVVDVGLRLSPSLELLQQLAPDLILINSSQESQRAMLERIAPVRAFAIYTDAGTPWERSVAVTRELGQICHCEAQASALITRAGAVVESARLRLAHSRFTSPLPSPLTSAPMLASTPASASIPARPTHAPSLEIGPTTSQASIYLIQFFDPRHIGIYGPRSVFQDVMRAMAVRNAWQGPTDYWGVGIVGIEKLAQQPSAAILYFGPLPLTVSAGLATNRLWHALPAVASGQVAALPAFWGFGMLPSAMRFADALTTALMTL